MMQDYFDDRCRLHRGILNGTLYWSIINDKEIVMLSTLRHAEEYFEKHEKSNNSLAKGMIR